MGDFAWGRSDEEGRPCAVTYATPVQHNRSCYEVLFSDGESIVADADHQWSVFSDNDRKQAQCRRQRVLTTSEMARSVRFNG